MTRPRTSRRKPSVAPAPAAAEPRRTAAPLTPASSHLLIRASAGTGKTFQLSGRFIDRLRTSEPEHILATTFTRAAAGEILERVLLRLAEAALDDAQRVALSQQVALPDGCELAAADCLALLAGLTRNLHRVRVGTLDSFFIQLAQCFSLELGLPPGWRILDGIEEELLLTLAIERLLHRSDAAEIGPLLNLLSRGDAGRSVVRNLRWAASSFYDVYQSTTAEAWNRLPEPPLLSPERLRESLEALEAATEHLPQKEAWIKAHRKSTNEAWEGEWEAFLTGGIGKVVAEGNSDYCRAPIPAPVLSAYADLIPHARAVLVQQWGSRNSVTFELLHRLHGEIQALKHEHQGLTFGDVTRALGAGWKQGVLTRLDYRLDAAVEHLLLDEFQDTSVPQWQALEPLARRVTSAEHCSLFCVGDQKQAIFGWRGGVAELFDAVQQRLEGVVDAPLARSFRSAPAVIEAVNRVFTNLHLHPKLERAEAAVRRWQSRFDWHETAKTDLPGWVTLEAAGEATAESAFQHTALRVAELHRETPRLSIGVLAKTNDAVALLARLIRQHGVEVSEEGTSQLDDNVAVQVITSLLRVADHPGDTAARFHVVTSPLGAALETPPSRPSREQSPADEAPGHGPGGDRPGVPANPAGNADAEAEGVAQDDPDLPAWERFSAGIRRELLEQGYGRCVERWARVLAPHCDPRGVSRLRQLVDLAHDYDAHATLRPVDFSEFIAAHPAVQPGSARVRVMTIHRSKGLEFDVVFLPELNQKSLTQPPEFVTGHPSPVDEPDTVIRYASEFQQSLLPPELQAVFQAHYERKVAEALCVLYVALTRARHALHLVVFPAQGGEKSRNMATLLRASLTNCAPLPAGAVVTISGDADWRQQLPREQQARSVAAPQVSAPPLAVSLGASHAGLSRRERVRPSRHSTQRVRLRELLKPGNAAAMSRGTLIHAWCEQVQWLDDGPPSDDLLRRIAQQLALPDVDVEQSLRSFRDMLSAPAMSAALSRRAYAAAAPDQLYVLQERRILTPVDEQLVNGCIDRLVLIERGGRIVAAEILDFKTDVFDLVTADTARQRRAGYHEQMRLYRQAVAHVYDLPRNQIGARLLYLASGEVEEVREEG